MTDQLGFDLVEVTERRYTCCGQPCAPLEAEERKHSMPTLFDALDQDDPTQEAA